MNLFTLGTGAPPFITVSCLITCLAAAGAATAYLKDIGYNIGLIPMTLGFKTRANFRHLLVALFCCLCIAWVNILVLPDATGENPQFAQASFITAVKLTLLLGPLIILLIALILVAARNCKTNLDILLGLREGTKNTNSKQGSLELIPTTDSQNEPE